MEQIEKGLTQIGLTPSEARVYVTGLRHQNIGVQELSRLTSLKRPTIYHALHELEAKGLLTKAGTGRRLVFRMQPPEQLQRILNDQEALIGKRRELLESFMPLLIPQVMAVSTIQVRHVEGIQGMKALIDEALYCKVRQWSIFAPRRNFFSDMDSEYARSFLATRTSRGIRARSLWERPDTKRLSGRRLTPQELQDRHPRYIPASLSGRYAATLIIFDDKVLFLSSLQERHGILIQAQEIHDLLLTMFDGLWLISEPYEKVFQDS